MPLYEYECSKCHHRFEKIEKVTANEVRKCPKCGSPSPRQISRSAIQFKGSGWYVTDYGAHKPAEKSQDSKAGASDSGGNSGAGDSGAGKTGESAEKGRSGEGKLSEGKSGADKSGSEKSRTERASGEKLNREKSGGSGKKGKRD